MGNSCTFGWGVSTKAGYPHQVAILLRKFQVINAGVPGYTSLQGKRLYASDLTHLRPDYVTILFAFNDHWAAANEIPDKDQQPPPQWILDIQNRLGELHSYRLLKKAILSTIEPSMDSLYSRKNPVYRVGLEDFRKNLIDLVTMIRADSARPILLTSPIASLERYYPPGHKSNLHTYHEFYNATIREVATGQNCLFVDLARELDKHAGLFDDPLVDPIHFNEEGHRIVAGLLMMELAQELRPPPHIEFSQ
jgi:lysophospholipase L1-like esterase